MRTVLRCLAVFLFGALTIASTSVELGVDRLNLEKRDIVFAAFGGWDAAGAKSFGYPTVWVNRLNQPLEQLGIQPDRTVTDLNGLLDFVLKQER